MPGALPLFSTMMPMSSSSAVNALVNPGSSPLNYAYVSHFIDVFQVQIHTAIAIFISSTITLFKAFLIYLFWLNY